MKSRPDWPNTPPANILVRHHVRGNGDAAAAVHYGDLSGPDAVERSEGKSVSNIGPDSGVVSLLPLAEPPRAEGPMERMQRELKSLYLLARGLEQELRQAGSAGPAVLLTATGLGGGLGSATSRLPITISVVTAVSSVSSNASLSNGLKSSYRVVDLDIHEPKRELAEHSLLAELSATNGRPKVVTLTVGEIPGGDSSPRSTRTRPDLRFKRGLDRRNHGRRAQIPLPWRWSWPKAISPV